MIAMAHLNTHQQEKINKWFSTGGRIAAIAGPRRSGLTWCVDTLVARIATEQNTRLYSIDIRENSQIDTVRHDIASQTKTRHTDGTGDLSAIFQKSPSGLWYFKNFHRANPELSELILNSCVRSQVHQATSSNFIFEGAVEFEEAIAQIKDHLEPFIGHVDPLTPWRTIVEVEHLISKLSSSLYPRSLVVWLADVTNGDTGFCNEFLLRLQNPNPSATILRSTYDTIVQRGATARDIRRIADSFPNTVIETLLSGKVIPGLAPPQGSREATRLVLSGISQYDDLVGGYRLRSPLVGDALRAEGKWNAKPPTEEPGVGSCNHLLWQVSIAEMLLRTLMHSRSETNERISEMTVPPPWKGKAGEVKRELAGVLKELGLEDSMCKQLLKASAAKLNDILPDALNAAERARSILERTADWDGTNLLNGLTFSDIANLATNLGVVTGDERDQLKLVNDRRNDAAHFRPVGYDDAFNLERIVRELLPAINARTSVIAKE